MRKRGNKTIMATIQLALMTAQAGGKMKRRGRVYNPAYLLAQY
jgi:hypothetical protein